ncbi:hypothetical protein ABPG72_013356 [Tetrahymena utriculariae]
MTLKKKKKEKKRRNLNFEILKEWINNENTTNFSNNLLQNQFVNSFSSNQPKSNSNYSIRPTNGSNSLSESLCFNQGQTHYHLQKIQNNFLTNGISERAFSESIQDISNIISCNQDSCANIFNNIQIVIGRIFDRINDNDDQLNHLKNENQKLQNELVCLRNNFAETNDVMKMQHNSLLSMKIEMQADAQNTQNQCRGRIFI